MDSVQDSTVPDCPISMEQCLHFSLIPAVLIVGVLSFFQRRTQTLAFDQTLPFLRSRFGIVVPLDSMGFSNRWSYGFAFGAVSYSVVELFNEHLMPKVFPVWAKSIAYLIGSFEVGLAYFPFFACLSTPFRATGAVMGILYSSCWITVITYDVFTCPSGEVWGQYQKLIYQWPWILSLIFLLGRFILQLVKAVRIHCEAEQDNSEELMHVHQIQHVKRLLSRTAYSRPLSWFQRHVYDWDPHFKFPNRVIGTAIISLFALYTLVVTDIGEMSQLFNLFDSMINPPSTTYGLVKDEKPMFSELLDVSAKCWHVTTALAILNSVAYICHVLVCYRKHMKRLWRGQKDFLPEKFRNPSSAVSVASIAKYCGWQIAFTLWGYVIVHIVQFLVAMIFSYLLVLPIKHGHGMELLSNLWTLTVTFGLIFGLFLLQVALVNFLFLQDKLSSTDTQKPLALNNRKAFHCFNYFFFFYNVVMGITGCCIRILSSFVVGTWLVSRIDRTIMPKGYEGIDRGYRTWVGMIFADHYHNNPVMVCFCQLLLSHTQESQHGPHYAILNNLPFDSVNCRVRKRWRLFYTLLKNPHLIPLRKHHLSMSASLNVSSSAQADIVVRTWLMRSQAAPQSSVKVTEQS